MLCKLENTQERHRDSGWQMNGVDSVLHVHRSIGTMADKLVPKIIIFETLRFKLVHNVSGLILPNCLTAPFRARDLCTRLEAENQCLWWVLPRVNTVRSPGWSWPQLCRILRVILKFRNCLFPQSAPWLGCWFPSNSWSAAACPVCPLLAECEDTMSFLLETVVTVRSC